MGRLFDWTLRGDLVGMLFEHWTAADYAAVDETWRIWNMNPQPFPDAQAAGSTPSRETCTYTYGDGDRCNRAAVGHRLLHDYVHEHVLVDPDNLRCLDCGATVGPLSEPDPEPEFDIDAQDPAGFVEPGGDGTLHPVWAHLTPEALNEVGERVAQVLEDYRPEIILTPRSGEGAPDLHLEEALTDAAAAVAWSAYDREHLVNLGAELDPPGPIFRDGFRDGVEYERLRGSL